VHFKYFKLICCAWIVRRLHDARSGDVDYKCRVTYMQGKNMKLTQGAAALLPSSHIDHAHCCTSCLHAAAELQRGVIAIIIP